MTVAVCPGSFDPMTYGHLDVVRRALTLADRVIVAMAYNSAKTALLPIDERVRIARAATADLAGVEVAVVPGLLMDFVRDVDAAMIIKGLRGGADLDHEVPMALMNRAVGDVETVFVLGDPALAHIASSLVKDIARHGGDVSAFVPPVCEQALRRGLLRERDGR